MILVMTIPQFSIFDGIISNCHVWRINRLGKVNYVSRMKEDLTILIATTLTTTTILIFTQLDEILFQIVTFAGLIDRDR